MSMNMMKTIHTLKMVLPYFQSAWDGIKPFEIRKNDRNFKVGDTIILREYLEDSDSYTGRRIKGEIVYITDYGQKKGMVVFAYRSTWRYDPKKGSQIQKEGVDFYHNHNGKKVRIKKKEALEYGLELSS